VKKVPKIGKTGRGEEKELTNITEKRC